MFARILGSKWLVTAAVLVVGVGAVVVAVGTRESAPTARQYCAVMADGIGVFTGILVVLMADDLVDDDLVGLDVPLIGEHDAQALVQEGHLLEPRP